MENFFKDAIFWISVDIFLAWQRKTLRAFQKHILHYNFTILTKKLKRVDTVITAFDDTLFVIKIDKIEVKIKNRETRKLCDPPQSLG